MSNITLQGLQIIQLLTPEERAELQAELQAVIDKWYRVKFALTATSLNNAQNGNIPQQETTPEKTE